MSNGPVAYQYVFGDTTEEESNIVSEGIPTTSSPAKLPQGQNQEQPQINYSFSKVWRITGLVNYDFKPVVTLDHVEGMTRTVYFYDNCSYTSGRLFGGRGFECVVDNEKITAYTGFRSESENREFAF